MAKYLVWMTNSFRADSRLTASLTRDCTFVYYSPYYFAGQREQNTYRTCSQQNLNLFYSSINSFDEHLRFKGGKLHIFKTADPIAHINSLVQQHGFTSVIIDQPLFAMWHTVDLNRLTVPCSIVDSALIDTVNLNMTAKSRWTKHIKHLPKFKPYKWNPQINVGIVHTPDFALPYPDVPMHDTINVPLVLEKLYSKIFSYGDNRNRHDGQTGLSTPLHNGVIDPHNIFFSIGQAFKDKGHDPTEIDGPAAAILRQLAFREISIIRARANNLTLEDSPQVWASKLMHIDAYNNMLNATPNATNPITWRNIKDADTGDNDLDFLILDLYATGTMPNRGRMYYASKIFYESATGLDALTNLINTFDLIGLDGQSPNNYVQCCGALGLSYGKVLKMNRDRAFELLGYKQ